MKDNLYDIDKSIKSLISNFEKISKNGWFIKETINPGEIGNNFEKLLGKSCDNFQVADYEGIEIKTKSKSKYSEYITLFNLTPIGKDFFEINRLKNTYGYPDLDLKDCKVLNGDIFCKTKNKIGAKFYFQTKLDNENQKLKLLVFNKYNELIDEQTFWTYEMIKERIAYKLEYLALISVQTKIINNKKIYKYEHMDIYKFINFENFINAIENDYIRIQLKIGVFKSGKRIGQTHDRGTGFQINKNHIESLYKKIYSSNKAIEK